MKTTVNWCYGAKTPDMTRAIESTIESAHRYRNTLCRLELEKRDRHYAILRELAPDFVACEADIACVEKQLSEAQVAIQKERVRQRTKTPKGVDGLIKLACDAKAELKILRAKLKQAKQTAYADLKVVAAMQANTATHKTNCDIAKRDSGLYWGTEAIVRQSCSSFASGAPPKFSRYTGEGQLAVQLQGGLNCENGHRYNTLCYLDGGNCYFRIGSEGKSKRPIFARVPIVFHRELPNGDIKWAYLERRKIANHVRWTLRLTIDLDVHQVDRTLPGEVAVHTGWRMDGDDLRVATWRGSDGKQGFLRLSASHLADYMHLDQLKSIRDIRFNSMIIEIKEFLKDRDDLPDWLDDARKTIHSWKSKHRLCDLSWRWHGIQLDGDVDLFNKLQDWRDYDNRAWQHECRLSARISRRRKYYYRQFAVALAAAYGVAIVSPIDAKVLTENSEPEELDRDNTLAHRRAKWAAVSELVQVIREKFGLHCVDVECTNISQQCSNCESLESVGGRHRQCRGCGMSEDVDDRAVANILARGQAAINTGALLELVAQKEDKDRKAKEKLFKMQAANRAARQSRQKVLT